MEREYKSVKLEVKQDEQGKDLYLEGYALTFDIEDSYGDIIKPGATLKTIGSSNGKRIKFCYQHYIDRIAGKIVEMREDAKGLFIKIKVGNGMWGKEVRALIEDESIDEFSIGFRTVNSTYDENTEIRYLNEIELWEVSIVSRAANQEANLIGVEVKSDLTDEQLIELKNKIELEITKRVIRKL